MSDIVLSASVRQNLLSLQSTADLLATTQTRLATGNKVNSALDNPTNFFTAQSLDSRASDINNLLDGIGNGVQVLQAANTGITSLQKLVDTAKSIANQALQTPLGYTKSTATSAASSGITANDLLGTTPAVTNSTTGTQLANNVTETYQSSTVAGTAAVNSNVVGTAHTTATATAGAQLTIGTAGVSASGSTLLSDLTDGTTATPTGPAANDTLVVNGKTIKFVAAGGVGGTLTADTSDPSGNSYTLGIDASLDQLTTAINTLQGGGAASTDTGGVITLDSGTAADLNVSGTAAAKLGLTAANQLTATRTVTAGTTTTAPITGSTLLKTSAAAGTNSLSSGLAAGDEITVDGKTLHFYDSSLSSGANSADSTADANLDLNSATINDLLGKIDTLSGNTGTGATASSVDTTTGKLLIQTGKTQDLDLSDNGTTAGSVLAKLGVTVASSGANAGHSVTDRLATPATAPAITGTTKLSGAVGTDSLSSGFSAGDSITVNGTTINFVASGATGNDVNITDDVSTLLGKINTISGGTSSVVDGKIKLNSGTAADLVLGGSATTLAKLGLTATTTPKSTDATSALDGKTLTIGPTGGATVGTTITFGDDDSAGEVSTLDELNAKLASNNLQASISTTGAITLTTTNDAASADIGAIGGTVTNPGGVFSGVTVQNAVTDANSQATRASLVSQYNNVIDQIKTTAQDSSFNGVNLLNGDQLKLVFNETGTSTLSITGVTFDPAGLGLGSLTAGTDFVDNGSTNKILSALNDASTTLRGQASALGSNLSVVQIRQDFSKNLINVLQTGSSNLTLADTNEEAANSQALSTRQSIAVSALALANQSNQSVLQLLR